MDPIKTILILDDNTTSCFLAERLIKKELVVNQVLCVFNGRNALLKIKELFSIYKKLPQVIFLVIHMPVMDGFEFLEALAREPYDLHNTRIYILSSSAAPRDINKALSYPVAVSGYISKPLTAENLRELFQK